MEEFSVVLIWCIKIRNIPFTDCLTSFSSGQEASNTTGMKSTLLSNIWLRNSPGTKASLEEKHTNALSHTKRLDRGFVLHKIYEVCHLIISGLSFIVSQSNAANVLHRVLKQRKHHHETHGKQVRRDTSSSASPFCYFFLSTHFCCFNLSKGDHKKRP